MDDGHHLNLTDRLPLPVDPFGVRQCSTEKYSGVLFP